MKSKSRMRLSFVCLMLTAMVFFLVANGCDDKSDLNSKADEAIEQADKIAADADEVAEKAQKAINDAEEVIEEAQEADDAEALVFATTKLNAAKNAKKKAENAKRKAKNAKEQAKKAKSDKSQEDLDNAKENKDQAKDLPDEAKGILNDLDGIAGARKTLRDLGFTGQELDDLLSELNATKETSEGAPLTATGQPSIDYRRVAGDKLREKGVDMSTPEGQKKLDSAAKAIRDLFHGEGKVGDGADAPYPD